METYMTQRVNTISAFSLAIATSLLFATAALAQQGDDLSPVKPKCDSSTGCANYPTGDAGKTNPAAQPKNATSPQGSDLSPAKSNCTSSTGCANDPTGDANKSNPTK
jgi:hypothetical protein